MLSCSDISNNKPSEPKAPCWAVAFTKFWLLIFCKITLFGLNSNLSNSVSLHDLTDKLQVP